MLMSSLRLLAHAFACTALVMHSSWNPAAVNVSRSASGSQPVHGLAIALPKKHAHVGNDPHPAASRSTSLPALLRLLARVSSRHSDQGISDSSQFLPLVLV